MITRDKLRFKEPKFDEKTTMFFKGKVLKVDKFDDMVFDKRIKIKRME